MLTYLYIKRHSVTGLCYFGKTSKKDPYVYMGSGKYWVRHIKRHGVEHVETLQVWSFESLKECSEFALKFSEDNNIVGSEEWANLKPENGLDGGAPKSGKPLSKEHKEKISNALKGRKASLATREKLSASLTGRTRSLEHRQNISKSAIGRKRPPFSSETRRKISEHRLGTKHSEQTIQKLKEVKQGSKNPFSGRQHSNETKQRMSEQAKERAKGRFYIVDINGQRRFCWNLDDPRLASGEFQKGTKWRD